MHNIQVVTTWSPCRYGTFYSRQVKERMEQSGMRWSSQGAQNIMDLRAIKLNEDMDDFMQFVINKDRIRKNGMAP